MVSAQTCDNLLTTYSKFVIQLKVLMYENLTNEHNSRTQLYFFVVIRRLLIKNTFVICFF